MTPKMRTPRAVWVEICAESSALSKCLKENEADKKQLENWFHKDLLSVEVISRKLSELFEEFADIIADKSLDVHLQELVDGM